MRFICNAHVLVEESCISWIFRQNEQSWQELRRPHTAILVAILCRINKFQLTFNGYGAGGTLLLEFRRGRSKKGESAQMDIARGVENFNFDPCTSKPCAAWNLQLVASFREASMESDEISTPVWVPSNRVELLFGRLGAATSLGGALVQVNLLSLIRTWLPPKNTFQFSNKSEVMFI